MCERVDRGMFSGELTITVKRTNGEEESYFVPVTEVQRDDRRVRVEISDRDAFVWATLPTADPVTIPVDKASIKAA